MANTKDFLKNERSGSLVQDKDVVRLLRNLLKRVTDLEATSGLAATNTLSGTQNAADTDTVVIGFSGSTKTYTLQDTLTDVDGNVHIGADLAETLDNLVAAINLGAGSGTAYAASMTLNPDVSAARGVNATDLELVITAKTVGAIGNEITTTETFTNDPEWASATMTGGQ